MINTTENRTPEQPEKEEESGQPCASGAGSDPASATGCCSGSVVDSGNNTGKSSFSPVKLAIFLGIMATAVVVGGYSLLNHSSEPIDEALTAGSPCCPGGTTACEPRLSPLAQQYIGTHDVVFVLLSADNTPTDKAVGQELDAAVSALTAEGKQVERFIVPIHTDDYRAIAKEFSIRDYPAVLVLKQGGGSQVLSGDITTGRLLNAWHKVSAAASTGSRTCG